MGSFACDLHTVSEYLDKQCLCLSGNSKFKFCCFYSGLSLFVFFSCFLPTTPWYLALHQNPHNHIHGRRITQRAMREDVCAAVRWGLLMLKTQGWGDASWNCMSLFLKGFLNWKTNNDESGVDGVCDSNNFESGIPWSSHLPWPQIPSGSSILLLYYCKCWLVTDLQPAWKSLAEVDQCWVITE